jgi:hypothetical protein
MTVDTKTRNAMSVLRRIAKAYCSKQFVHSAYFLETLRNYRFESIQELDETLDAYCALALTREVRNAIFIDLPDDAPIAALNLQTSISRGMTHTLTVNEFIGHGGVAVPKWYLDAKVRLEVPKQEQK